MKYQTKQGKHGTLYRFRVHYTSQPEIDDGQPYFESAIMSWAYDEEHAREKFEESEDGDGWRITKISKMKVK